VVTKPSAKQRRSESNRAGAAAFEKLKPSDKMIYAGAEIISESAQDVHDSWLSRPKTHAEKVRSEIINQD
jgi:hypothetical protein